MLRYNRTLAWEERDRNQGSKVLCRALPLTPGKTQKNHLTSRAWFSLFYLENAGFAKCDPLPLRHCWKITGYSNTTETWNFILKKKKKVFKLVLVSRGFVHKRFFFFSRLQRYNTHKSCPLGWSGLTEQSSPIGLFLTHTSEDAKGALERWRFEIVWKPLFYRWEPWNWGVINWLTVS